MTWPKLAVGVCAIKTAVPAGSTDLSSVSRFSSEGVISVEAPPMKETIRPFRSSVAGAARPGRLALFEGLREGSSLQTQVRSCLVPQSAAQYSLPAHIGDYTDFYTSVHHAA